MRRTSTGSLLHMTLLTAIFGITNNGKVHTCTFCAQLAANDSLRFIKHGGQYKGSSEVHVVNFFLDLNHFYRLFLHFRPIHDAVDNNWLELVRMLLAYGADPLIATYSGRTTIKLARTKAMKTFIIGKLSQGVKVTGHAW